MFNLREEEEEKCQQMKITRKKNKI